MTEVSSENPNLPVRVIHLLGGLRAVDDRKGQIHLQVGSDNRLGHFPAPRYAEAYSALQRMGFTPIGAEFVSGQSVRGLDAPDWECASPTQGFRILEERRNWSDVRTAAFADKNFDIADMASRVTTYLSLLSIRLLELSNAYNRTFRPWYSREDRKPGLLFGNRFQPYIDAAIHAFVADAGAFRDLIAEIVWRLILNEPPEVTTYAKLIRRARQNTYPLVQTMVAAGADGGWMKRFSDLRNEITHVAPVGRSQSFHMCHARSVKLGSGEALLLHYPLLAADGSIRRVDNDAVDFDDEGSIKKNLAEYSAYSTTSIDALAYAWETLGSLVGLITDVRTAAGLRQEGMVITEDDIIGEVKFISR